MVEQVLGLVCGWVRDWSVKKLAKNIIKLSAQNIPNLQSGSLKLGPGQPCQRKPHHTLRAGSSHHNDPKLYSTLVCRPTKNSPWAQRLLRTCSLPSGVVLPKAMVRWRQVFFRTRDVDPLGAAWIPGPPWLASIASVQAVKRSSSLCATAGQSFLLPQPLMRVYSFSRHQKVLTHLSIWALSLQGFLFYWLGQLLCWARIFPAAIEPQSFWPCAVPPPSGASEGLDSGCPVSSEQPGLVKTFQ